MYQDKRIEEIIELKKKEFDAKREQNSTDYEQLLCIIDRVQDFGVRGGMGDIVNNETLAKVLSEQGCVIAKPLPNVRRKRYSNNGER